MTTECECVVTWATWSLNAPDKIELTSLSLHCNLKTVVEQTSHKLVQRLAVILKSWYYNRAPVSFTTSCLRFWRAHVLRIPRSKYSNDITLRNTKPCSSHEQFSKTRASDDVLREMEIAYENILSWTCRKYTERLQETLKLIPSPIWKFVRVSKSMFQTSTNVISTSSPTVNPQFSFQLTKCVWCL